MSKPNNLIEIIDKGEREFEEQFVSYDCEKANGHPCHLEKHRIRIQSHHLKQSIALVEGVIAEYERIKKATQEVNGTFKYDVCYEECIEPLEELQTHLQKRLQELK